MKHKHTIFALIVTIFSMPVFAATELFVGVGYALPVRKSSAEFLGRGENTIKHSGLNFTVGAIFAKKHRLSIMRQKLSKKKLENGFYIKGEMVALSYDYHFASGLYLGASLHQNTLEIQTERPGSYLFSIAQQTETLNSNPSSGLRAGYMLKITEESAVLFLLALYGTSYGESYYEFDNYYVDVDGNYYEFDNYYVNVSKNAEYNMSLFSLVYTYTLPSSGR